MKIKSAVVIFSSAVLLANSCGRVSEKSGGTDLALAGKTSVVKTGILSDTAALEPKPVQEKKMRPAAFERYHISFWDSAKMQNRPREEHPKIMSASAPQHEHKNPNVLVFRLGEAFANGSEHKEFLLKKLIPELSDTLLTDSVTDEVRFQECLSFFEKNNHSGTAAIIVSGYYFENLRLIAGTAGTQTNLPDEKLLSEGIAKLDSLKSYCNEALLSEADIKTTMPVQRIIALSDSLKAVYNESLTNGGNNKYDKLQNEIQQIESKIFEDRQ